MDILPFFASADPVKTWTFIIVGLSFALYIGIGWWAQARTTSEFYVAGSQVSPLANGMATAADWMSAASFISMAGLISFTPALDDARSLPFALELIGESRVVILHARETS